MGAAGSRLLLVSTALLLASVAGPPPGLSQEAAGRTVVTRDRLPVLGTVGDLPPAGSRVVVEVQPKGWMTVDGRSSDYAGFLKTLRTRAALGRPEKGPSPLHLVLRVDRDLPWQAVRWILAECAAPGVRVRRVLFAAAPEDGGEEGAFAFFQPDVPPPEAKAWQFELRLREVREPLCPGDVYASMDTLSTLTDPAEYYRSVSLKAVPRMATGDVLGTADMILRRGTRDLRLEGATPETVPDIEQALKALPPAAGTYSPWQGGPLRPFGERARRPPPVARVKGSLAGIFPAASPDPKEASPSPKPEPAVTIAGSPGFLPTIGIVGDLPPADRRILIEVDEKGAIAVDGGQVPYEALDSVLSQAVRREARPVTPGLSGYHAVLRLDRRLPWAAALRILDHCGRTSPPLRRVLFAVLPQDGGPEGAVGAFVPEFTRTGEHSREIREDRVLVVFAGYSKKIDEGLQPEELLTFLEEKRGPMSADRAWMVRMRIIPDVPVGTTLALYDMVLRWGTRCVVFPVEYNPKDEDLAGLVSILPPPKGKLFLSVTEGGVESPLQASSWGRHARPPLRRLQKWMAGLVDPDPVLLLPKPKPADEDPGEEGK